MLRNKSIICISSIDWDFIWQGHQEIMSTFADAENRVLFIENTGIRTPGIRDLPRLRKRISDWRKGVGGIRKVRKNLYVYSPIVIPCPYSQLVRPLNRWLFVSTIKRWMNVLDFSDPIIWTYLPTNISIDLIDCIENKELVLYYSVAEFSELVSSPKKVNRSEKELLKRSQLVFAQGKKIKERCAKYNPNIHIFHAGVSDSVFLNRNIEKKPVPPDLKSIPFPIIGYVGGIHKHIDMELVRYLALKRRDWSFVFVGPLQIETGDLRKIKNIHFLGKKPHEEIPAYILRFNVCIIPYLIDNYTDTVFPTKLYEYLIMGKPVVSTALPEVLDFNGAYARIVNIAANKEAFFNAIFDNLKSGQNELVAERINVARQNTWDERISRMAELMRQAIGRLKSDKEAKWREKITMLSKQLRRRVAGVALVLGLFYVLIFHTPVLWLMASPLKIDQKPVKSDAIAVFGGGVGETGKPGQGYTERSRYAIKLYKEGYAPKLIFSSGHTYYLKESEEMKNLAISQGVPGSSVITEHEAGSTYENVRNVILIMRREKMHSLILVSSPYHMRRSKLVFNKLRNGIDVTYCPIPESEFYADRKKIRWKHVKAILHEYMGIVYYLIKGYGRR